MVDTKKINKIMRAFKSVAKQSTKLVGASLPLATILANALDSYKVQGGDIPLAIKTFISRYHGVNAAGVFETERFMKGTGSLALAGLAGWLIEQIV